MYFIELALKGAQEILAKDTATITHSFQNFP